MNQFAIVRERPPRPTLRLYQVSGVDQVRDLFRLGHRAVLLVSPTGSGKTVIGSAVMHSAVDKGSRVVFLAHRKELIDQTVAKLEQWGIEAGVVMADDSRYDDYLPVQVCSTQTLLRRLDRLPPADLVVYDEAHHAMAASSLKVLESYPDARILGLTATPWRSDRKGLAELFSASVLVATPRELIEQGALVPYDAYAYDSPDLHGVGMVAGEFNQRQLATVCNTDVLVGSVVHEYLAHSPGKRALLFPVDVAHSRHLVTEFRIAGVAAEHLDAETPKSIREAILGNLARGVVHVVSSVGVLTEGFDSPGAEVILLARPTNSLGLFIQMVGRGLRPSPATGKTRCLIHDHAGNILRHGFPDDERDYSLTASPRRTADALSCPLCLAVFSRLPMDGRCPSCGEVISPKRHAAPAVASRGKREVKGTRLGREEIEALRAQMLAGGARADLGPADIRRVAVATPTMKAAEFKRLYGVSDSRGFSAGWVDREFRRTFGHEPKFARDELAQVEPAAAPFLRLPRRGAP